MNLREYTNLSKGDAVQYKTNDSRILTYRVLQSGTNLTYLKSDIDGQITHEHGTTMRDDFEVLS